MNTLILIFSEHETIGRHCVFFNNVHTMCVKRSYISASTGQYSRAISSVTYRTALNKKQQKAFSQFLLKEKLVYNDPAFKYYVYKLNYELSIIPNAF